MTSISLIITKLLPLQLLLILAKLSKFMYKLRCKCLMVVIKKLFWKTIVKYIEHFITLIYKKKKNLIFFMRVLSINYYCHNL